MNDATRHPGAQTMAAFFDGTLAPHEVLAVADHLRDCADCRLVMTETARFERDEEAQQHSRSRRWWWVAVAATVAAIAITIPLLRWNTRDDLTPIAQLIEASPREHRVVEARLSGFPWARLQPPTRGNASPNPADLKLAGTAGAVLEQTRDDRAPQSRHAEGVAYLLIGRATDSIAALERAAEEANDARMWNDLAAARYALATREDRPSELPLALAAADRALQIDPKSVEAHFNRALILEDLGAREAARAAWKKYLELDPQSAWADEARERLRRLENRAARFDSAVFDRDVFDRDGDRAAIETLVRNFPQETRVWGEGPLLADWADAAAKKDTVRANARLRLVRLIADSLVAVNSERMLGDVVTAIEGSQGMTRDAFVEGHRLYRDARIAYSQNALSRAEQQFRQAFDLFKRGSSPMAEVALYYAAKVTLDQSRGSEARDELLALMKRVDARRHRALAAQTHSTLAVEANITGDWGTGARESAAAAAIFRDLGESTNAAFVDSIAAHALELIGDRDRAWQHRQRAIEALCDGGDRERCNALLHDAATTLASIDHTDAAVALIDASIDADPTEAHADRAALLAKRARVASASSDREAVRRTLSAAHTAASHVTDDALRELLQTQIGVEEASLARDADPLAALGILDRAATFFADRQLRHLLPHIHLQRARAYRAAQNETAALAEYDAALDEIETQAGPAIALLDIAARVVDEAIDLHLSRGSVAEALAIADRRLAPRASRQAQEIRPAQGVAVIEYAVLPRALAIFCISSKGLESRLMPIDRRALAHRVDAFAGKIRRRAATQEIASESTALYALLIAPLQAQLAGVDELVIIPDRQLHAVPFAALQDDRNGKYLIESYTLRFAPSASGAGRTDRGELTPALVVADPPAANESRLRASREEATEIALMHGATLLAGEAATRERFVAAAKESALIHYAGHANSDAMTSYGALLLAPDADDSGILGTSDIARIPLQRNPLVILAACGTFRGDPVHVSGMSSLARAFLVAGARGVVGTLWEIDDDVSAPLFQQFHEILRRDVPPATALREAQLAMIRSADARLRHPATWSPIELLSHA